MCSKFENHCCASSSSPLPVMVKRSKPEAWIHSALGGFVLFVTSCEDWSVSSALFLAIALLLPWATTASLITRAHFLTVTSLTCYWNLCESLLTALWWYPWMCFVFFYIDDSRITNTSLWIPFSLPLHTWPTGTSNSTSRMELAFLPDLLVCLCTLIYSFSLAAYIYLLSAVV